jgi:hypothetical protein
MTRPGHPGRNPAEVETVVMIRPIRLIIVTDARPANLLKSIPK